jgi:hypothetical protein
MESNPNSISNKITNFNSYSNQQISQISNISSGLLENQVNKDNFFENYENPYIDTHLSNGGENLHMNLNNEQNQYNR